MLHIYIVDDYFNPLLVHFGWELILRLKYRHIWAAGYPAFL